MIPTASKSMMSGTQRRPPRVAACWNWSMCPTNITEPMIKVLDQVQPVVAAKGNLPHALRIRYALLPIDLIGRLSVHLGIRLLSQRIQRIGTLSQCYRIPRLVVESHRIVLDCCVVLALTAFDVGEDD